MKVKKMSKVQISSISLLLNVFLQYFALSQGDRYGCFIDNDDHEFYDCKMCRVGMDCGLMNGMPFKCNTIPECPVEHTYSLYFDCIENCPPPYFGCSPAGCKDCNEQNCDDVKTGQFYSSREDCRAGCDAARPPSRSDVVCQETNARVAQSCQPSMTVVGCCALELIPLHCLGQLLDDRVYAVECGKNQVFTMCKRCEPTCDKTFFSNCNTYINCKAACRCKKGFVRHRNSCIRPSQCPKCREYSEYRHCPYEDLGGCPRTCEYPEGDLDCYYDDCDYRQSRDGGCECQRGLMPVGYGDDTCVPKSQCPPDRIYYYCEYPEEIYRCTACQLSLTDGGEDVCPTNVKAYHNEESCLDNCNENTYVKPINLGDLIQYMYYFCQAPTGPNRCGRCIPSYTACPINAVPYQNELLCLIDCNSETFVQPVFPSYFCFAPLGIDRCASCAYYDCPKNVVEYQSESLCLADCNPQTYVQPIYHTGRLAEPVSYFCQTPTGPDRCRRCIFTECPTNVVEFQSESLCLANCNSQSYVQPTYPFGRLAETISYFCQTRTGPDRCRYCINSECPRNVLKYESENVCLANCKSQTYVLPIYSPGSLAESIRYFCVFNRGTDRCGRCIYSECPINVVGYQTEEFCQANCNDPTFASVIYPKYLQGESTSYFCQATTGVDRCGRCEPLLCPSNVGLYQNEEFCLSECNSQSIIPIFPDIPSDKIVYYFCQAETGPLRCVRCLSHLCPTNAVKHENEQICLANCNSRKFVFPRYPTAIDEEGLYYVCQAPTGPERCAARCLSAGCPKTLKVYRNEEFCLANCNSQTFVELRSPLIESLI